jgi:hypothetical protein
MPSFLENLGFYSIRDPNLTVSNRAGGVGLRVWKPKYHSRKSNLSGSRVSY